MLKTNTMHLVAFKDGVFETNDPQLIESLRNLKNMPKQKQPYQYWRLVWKDDAAIVTSESVVDTLESLRKNGIEGVTIWPCEMSDEDFEALENLELK